MTRSCILSILVVLAIAHVSAQNLVPNPSFEEVTSCPNFASQLDRAAPWFNPTLGSPELYHGCAPLSSYVSVPENTTGGFQFARTGIGYAGLFTWRSDLPNVREYAEVPLLAPLEAGSCYLVRFHVNMPNDHPFAVDRFGAHFSVGPIASTDGYVLPVAEHIGNPAGQLITDTLGWTEISGVYTALGGETHLTIGNFQNDAQTQSLQIATGLWYQTTGYLLLDDVSVEKIILDVDLGPDTLICEGGDILLDASTPDATYLWSDGSTGPTLTATSAGTFWVRVALGGCSASDTVVIDMDAAPEVDLPTVLTACPGASITLDVSQASGTVLWMDGDTSAVRTVEPPGRWSVTVSNACGSSTAEVDVRTGLCPCVPYLPNAFTPNGDGINDAVAPQFRCVSGALSWSVHDRWGRRIHSGSGSNSAWDGTLNGRDAPPGVYVWSVSVSGPLDVRGTWSGHITLLR